MKMTIISDIKSEKGSIITYGLNLAKSIEAEVDIVHVIDTRINHGVTTPYSDSHTVAPGEKLSFEEILNKEKGEADKELNQILSRELSRLNYPLKAKIFIEETSITGRLSDESEITDLVLVNKYPDGQIFISRDEMMEVCRKFGGMTLFVPPEAEFAEFRNALLPTDFSDKDQETYDKMSMLAIHFQPFINAVMISDKTEPETGEWKKRAEKIFINSDIHCHILNGNDRDETLIAYAQKINPDLILFAARPSSLLKNMFKKDPVKKLLEHTDTPVLYCFSQGSG